MDFVLRAIAGTDGASLYWAGSTVWTLKLDEAVRFKSDKAAKATAVMLSACGVIRGDAECVAFGPTVLVDDVHGTSPPSYHVDEAAEITDAQRARSFKDWGTLVVLPGGRQGGKTDAMRRMTRRHLSRDECAFLLLGTFPEPTGACPTCGGPLSACGGCGSK